MREHAACQKRAVSGRVPMCLRGPVVRSSKHVEHEQRIDIKRSKQICGTILSHRDTVAVRCSRCWFQRHETVNLSIMNGTENESSYKTSSRLGVVLAEASDPC